MTPEDARKLLNIAAHVELTERAINRAFRRAALRHHPDKHLTADKATKNDQADIFKAANEAKDVLLHAIRAEPVAVTADENNYQAGGEGGGGGAAADDANPAQGKPTSRATATKRKKTQFPERLKMIINNDKTTKYNKLPPLFFSVVMSGIRHSLTVLIDLGTNLDGISTRQFLELILTVYIQANQLNCQDLIRLAFPGDLPQQPITAQTKPAKLTLVELNNSFVCPPSELRLLTDSQFRALLDKIGLAWMIWPNSIEVSSREISAEELESKSGMGHLLLPSDELTSELLAKNTRPTAVVETTTEIDLSSIGTYLNDPVWGNPAPVGIKAMRQFFNGTSRYSHDEILKEMKRVANMRIRINRTPERAPYWLRDQSLSARVNRFYNCLIAANGMDDVIRFVRGGANPSQALLPDGAAAGNGNGNGQYN